MISLSTKVRTAERISVWISVRPSVLARRPMAACSLVSVTTESCLPRERYGGVSHPLLAGSHPGRVSLITQPCSAAAGDGALGQLPARLVDHHVAQHGDAAALLDDGDDLA